MTSTWLIRTSKTPEQVFEVLKPRLGEKDYLLIVEIGKTRSGWLPADAWEWIRTQELQDALAALIPRPEAPPPIPTTPLGPPPKIPPSPSAKMLADLFKGFKPEKK